MFAFLLVVQVLLALAVIGLVLLQHGKGADMGAAFGSGSSGTVFGSRGSGSFFSRMTAVLAALFFVNSLVLSTPLVRDDGEGARSVTEQVSPALQESVIEEVEVPAADVPETPSVSEPSAAAQDLPPMTPVEQDAAAPATDLPE